ncbi:MAG: triphosphoribosyl-dephospho-CoA synthase [Candidatus Hadarchaeaceae archaeon]
MDIEDIARAAQLASALEVSGYPKPGNVHRTADLEEMTFEHFIASSIAIGPVLLDVAKKGFRVGKGEIKTADIGVGVAIKNAIENTMKWQRNGNTNLGIVLLLTPLAAAAGITLAKEGEIEMKKLRASLSNVLRSTTHEDALNVYDAILTANPEGLGRVDELDLKNVASKKRIKEERISLYEIMDISSGWDNISKEWVTDMRITFEFGYPLVKKFYERTKNMNTTTVQSFLEMLSKYPDTYVQRIHGKKIAEKVSEKARAIIEKGGMLTSAGRVLITKFDDELRKKDINPGTTADLTASSLMLAILDGLRP